MRLLFEIDKKDYDPNGEVTRRPSARAIICKDGKLALAYSRKYRYYMFPGGGVEPGEDYITAMIREVYEEVGLKVKEETVREFGYVHRIQKGKHEPVFIQDNFYYFCEVEDGQMEPTLTREEEEEEFIPCYVSVDEAIRVNEAYVKENSMNPWIERELKVLQLLVE